MIQPVTRSTYVPHIDGLRAVAVLSVIVYHLNQHWLPGGLSGVDIFFVISGFVVSASLADFRKSTPQAFFAHFYARRMLRILPALVTCLLVTHVFAMLFIPWAWLSDANQRTGLYAFFGLSNFFLARRSQQLLRAACGIQSVRAHLVAWRRGAVLSDLSAAVRRMDRRRALAQVFGRRCLRSA